jgi:hypothetical protein
MSIKGQVYFFLFTLVEEKWWVYLKSIHYFPQKIFALGCSSCDNSSPLGDKYTLLPWSSNNYSNSLLPSKSLWKRIRVLSLQSVNGAKYYNLSKLSHSQFSCLDTVLLCRSIFLLYTVDSLFLFIVCKYITHKFKSLWFRSDYQSNIACADGSRPLVERRGITWLSFFFLYTLDTFVETGTQYFRVL